MHEVFSQLESHGIRPNYACDIDSENNKDEELIVRVKRRANEIRQSWHKVEGEDTEVNGEDLHSEKPKNEELSDKGTAYLDPKAPPIKICEKTVATLVRDKPNINSKAGEVSTNKVSKEKGERPLYDFRNRIVNDRASATKANKNANRLESRVPSQNNPEVARNSQKPLFDFRK